MHASAKALRCAGEMTQRRCRYVVHHPELDRCYGSGRAYCVGCCNDIAVRLQEDAFVATFIDGWSYECVWGTSTRQDSELIVKVFRRDPVTLVQ